MKVTTPIPSAVLSFFLNRIIYFLSGEESYDNMWQKSRSIWKYIATHYLNSFDYFLLGGDDMFYIIENLRAYLNSQEIQTLRNERDGAETIL